MRRKPTVSIGIPAYNEEANIGNLLKALLVQKETNFKLKEIIVVSDGSTDKTDEIILSIKDTRVVYIKNFHRQGQQSAQNTILNKGEGDIFIFIEADVIPKSKTTICELVKPFTKDIKGIGMVVGSAYPILPQGFFEKILFHGYLFKQSMFRNWKKGNNVYMAGGHSMKTITKKFAKVLIWPNDVPEDAYIYFRLQQFNLKMLRNSKAVAYMRNTTNFKDRIRQCKKFQSGKVALSYYFPKSVIKKEYNLPIKLVIKSIFQGIIRNPFWTSLYLTEVMINRILTLGSKKFESLYEPYYSSKNLADKTL